MLIVEISIIAGLIAAACFIIVFAKANGEDVTVVDNGCEDCCGAETCDCVPTEKVISQNIYRNRNGRRQKVGAFLSKVKNGRVLVGYALCNKSDKYDEKETLKIAGKRMGQAEVIVCDSLKDEAAKFLSRCQKYYNNPKKSGVVLAIPSFDGVTIKNK